jgi:hypothetical protein
MVEENAMTANTLEAKAHELLGQLNPGKLAAVVHLLEVMVNDGEEPITEEDRRRYHEGQAWFARHGGKGIPMEEVLSEFGLTPDDFPPSSCPIELSGSTKPRRTCAVWTGR